MDEQIAAADDENSEKQETEPVESVEPVESAKTNNDYSEKQNQNSHKSKPSKPSNIILVGMTACGKSTIGWLLSQQLYLGFFDTDAWIETQAGYPIAEIFKRDGEESFRQWEKKAITYISAMRNHVIAVGAGAFSDEEGRQNLESMGTVVYIDCPMEELVRRLKSKPTELRKRPLLADIADEADADIRNHKLTERLTVLLRQREQTYRLAGVTFFESFSTPEISAQALRDTLQKEKRDRS